MKRAMQKALSGLLAIGLIVSMGIGPMTSMGIGIYAEQSGVETQTTTGKQETEAPPVPDAGDPDAGDPDAGDPDAGDPDAGDPDAGDPDAGDPDAGDPDAGDPDVGNSDAGDPDAAASAGDASPNAQMSSALQGIVSPQNLTGDRLIYVSPTGNNSNDGLTPETAKSTLDGALALVGSEDATIVITGALNSPGNAWYQTKHTGMATITTHDGITDYASQNGARLVLYHTSANNYRMGGPTTFRDINIHANANHRLNGMGNKLVIDTGVTCTVASSGVSYPAIVGGSYNQQGSGDAELIIRSGTWRNAFAAGAGSQNSKPVTHTGNASLRIEGGEILGNVGGSADGCTITGDLTMVLTGGSVDRLIVQPPSATGSTGYVVGGNITGIIDISEGGSLSVGGSATVDLLLGGGNLTLEPSGDLTVTEEVQGTTTLTLTDLPRAKTYVTAPTGTDESAFEWNEVYEGFEDVFEDDGTHALWKLRPEQGAVSGVVYVDAATGSDANNGAADAPMRTIEAAFLALSAEGGTVVIASEVVLGGSLPEHAGTITVTSVYAGADHRDYGARLTVSEDINLNGPVVLCDVAVHTTGSSALYLSAQGHDLIIDTGVVTTAGSGHYLTLVGAKKSADLTGDTSVIVRSGTFGGVYGGGYSGAMTGNTSVLIEGGEITGILTGGSHTGAITGNTALTIDAPTAAAFTLSGTGVWGATYGGPVSGDAYLTIKGHSAIGKDVFGGGSTAAGTVGGTIYIDICENASVTNSSSRLYGGGDFGVAQNIVLTVRDNAHIVPHSYAGSFRADVPGSITATFSDNAKTTGIVFAGPRGNSTIRPVVTGDITLTITDNARAGNNVGGAVYATVNGALRIELLGNSRVAGMVEGVGQHAVFNAPITIVVDGATVAGAISGGTANWSGSSTVSSTIVLKSGLLESTINFAKVTGSKSLLIDLSAGKKLSLAQSIEVDDLIGGGELELGSGAELTVNGVMSGTTAISIAGIPQNKTYLTAAKDTPSSAVTYTPSIAGETLNYDNSGDRAVWSVTGSINEPVKAQFTYPDDVNFALYSGYSALDENKLEPEPDGSYTLEAGLYAYHVYGPGYYTITQVIYLSDEEIVQAHVSNGGVLEFDADPGKVYGDGFYQPNPAKQGVGEQPLPPAQWPRNATINLITDEMRAHFDVEHLKDADRYSIPYPQDGYQTPFFLREEVQGHRYTTNEEIANFIAALDAANDNLYHFVVGETALEKFPIHAVLLTTANIPAGATLEEAAAIVRADSERNNKPVIYAGAQLHGDEPTGSEGALAVMQMLCSSEHADKLNDMSIIIMPRLSPESAYHMHRLQIRDRYDPNREKLFLQMEENIAPTLVQSLFMPHITVDMHENMAGYLIANQMWGGPVDLWVGQAPFSFHGDEIEDYITEDFTQHLYRNVEENGLLAVPYLMGTTASSLQGQIQPGMFGSLALLLESRSINVGIDYYERRVHSQVVGLMTVIDKTIEDADQILDMVEARRAWLVEQGGLYDETDPIILDAEVSGSKAKSYNRKTLYYDGTLEDNYISFSYFDTAARTRTRPTGYLIDAAVARAVPDTTRVNQTDIVTMLANHHIEYFYLEPGTTVSAAQEYVISTGTGPNRITEIGLRPESDITLTNGAYFIPLDQVKQMVVTHLLEQDVDDNTNIQVGSLYQRGYITPDEQNNLPIYHYTKNNPRALLGDIPEPGSKIYVSGAGNDNNSGSSSAVPKKTVGAAIAALGDAGGTVVVAGADAVMQGDMPAHTGLVLITSIDGSTDYRAQGARLSVGANLNLNGPTTFNNLEIHAASTSALYLSAQGNKLEIGSGVSCTAAGSNYLSLVGARRTGSYTGDTDLTVRGGTWNNIYGAGYSGSMTGNTRVLVTGATVRYVVTGGSFSSTLNGNASLTIDAANPGDFVHEGTSTTAGVFASTVRGTVNGDVEMIIKGNTVVNNSVYGGAREATSGVPGTTTGTTTIQVSGNARILGDLYGGGKLANSGPIVITIEDNATIDGTLQGGSLNAGSSVAGATIMLKGGRIGGRVGLGIIDAAHVADSAIHIDLSGGGDLTLLSDAVVETLTGGGTLTLEGTTQLEVTGSVSGDTVLKIEGTPRERIYVSAPEGTREGAIVWGGDTDRTLAYADGDKATWTLTSTPTLTVYVDGAAGSDSADGLTAATAKETLTEAYNLLGNRGGIIVVSGVTDVSGVLPAHTGTVLLTSQDDTTDYRLTGARFNATGSVTLQGPTILRDIDLHHDREGTGTFILAAQGNELLIDTGVSCTKQGEHYMSLSGGGNSASITGDTNLTIRSGTWQNVCGGGFTGSVTGDTNLLIQGGRVTNILTGGGHTGNVTGDVHMRIEGGQFDNMVTGGSYNSNLTGTANLTIDVADASDFVLDGTLGTSGIFAATNNGTIDGNVNLTITGNAVTRSRVYGGPNATTGSVTGLITVTLAGNARLSGSYDFYGGSRSGNCGAIVVNLTDNAVVDNNLFAGSFTHNAESATVYLKGGSVGKAVQPGKATTTAVHIDLSQGGDLRLNNGLTVDTLTGGGTLTLNDDDALTVSGITTGRTTLEVAGTPQAGFAYVTTLAQASEQAITMKDAPTGMELVRTIDGANALWLLRMTNVYVDGTKADDTGDGLTPETAKKTLAAAYALLGDAGGTIVVCGETEFSGVQPAHSGTVTLTSADEAQLVVAANVDLNGPTVFKDLALHTADGIYAIAAQGHKLLVDTGVTSTKAGANYVNLVGANRLTAYTGNTDLTVRSGIWNNIYGAGQSGAMTGNANVRIEGGTVIVTLVGGSFTGKVTGDVNLTIDAANAGDFTHSSSSPNAGIFASTVTGTVEGNVNLFIQGNTEINTNVFGGARGKHATTGVPGTTTGTIDILVSGNAVLKKSLYGGGKISNTNQVNITLAENARIEGGLYAGYETEGTTVSGAVTLKGGTLLGQLERSNATDSTLLIDLSEGGALKLAQDTEVDTMTGGGKLTLGEFATLTVADRLSGSTRLELEGVLREQVYVTAPALAPAGAMTWQPVDGKELSYATAEGKATWSLRSAQPIAAGMVYVSDAGSDGNDGQTAETAKKTLGAAVGALGDAGGTVVVSGVLSFGTSTASENKLPVYTGRVVITSNDGQTDYRTSGAKLYLDNDIWLGGPTILRDITFDARGANRSGNMLFISACGHELLIDTGFESVIGSSHMLNVAGVARSGNHIGNTSLTIRSGNFSNIYGAGYSDTLTGNTNVTITGARVENTVTGGSFSGTVTGSTSLTIVPAAAADFVHAGTDTTQGIFASTIKGTTQGDVYLNIGGNAIIGTSVFGGGRDSAGTTQGTIYVDVWGNTFISGRLYGGGNNGTAGDVVMTVGGETRILGNSYLGPYNGTVGNLTGRFSGNAKTDGNFFLGARGTAAVINGNIHFTAGGNVVFPSNLRGGGHGGTIKGTTTIILNEGASVGSNLDGGGQQARSEGKITIILNGGSVGGAISGGTTSDLGGTATGGAEIILKKGSVGGELDFTGLSGGRTVLVDLSQGGNLSLLKGAPINRLIGGGSLMLGNATTLEVSDSISGVTTLTIEGVPKSGTYVTAPTGTAQDAVVYISSPEGETMSFADDGEKAAWSISDSRNQPIQVFFTRPDDVQFSLYQGHEELEDKKLQPNPDGSYTLSERGVYLTVARGDGYYTVLKPFWLSDEKQIAVNQAGGVLVVDADPGRLTGAGYNQPNPAREGGSSAAPPKQWTRDANVVLLNEELLNAQFSTDRLVSYPEGGYPTPAFTKAAEKGKHEYSSNADLEEFIHQLEQNNPQMRSFVIGYSEQFNFPIYLTVFTNAPLPERLTLKEAAELLRTDSDQNRKPIIFVGAQTHGNETSSAEGAMAYMSELCGAYGEEVLENVNVVVVPRINPDGAYLVHRYNTARALDINRDQMALQAKESAILVGAYNLFMPHVLLDLHENQANYLTATGVGSIDLWVGQPGLDANGSINDYVIKEFSQHIMQAAYDDGLYSMPYTPSTGTLMRSTYHGLTGTVTTLLEVRGNGIGKDYYDRRTHSHVVGVKAAVQKSIDDAECLMKMVEDRRAWLIEQGGIYDDTDPIALEVVSTGNITYSYYRPSLFYDGSQEDGTRSYSYYDEVWRERIRPTAYIIEAPVAEAPGSSITSHTNILKIMENHGIEYFYIQPGSTVNCRQLYATKVGSYIEEADLRASANKTFVNGAYFIPMDQVKNAVIALLFEQDATHNAEQSSGGTLYQRGYLTLDAQNNLPIYHYTQNNPRALLEELRPQHQAPTGLDAEHVTEAGGTGAIIGLEAERRYEYRTEDTDTYTAVPLGTMRIEGLAPGIYYVRLAADSEYNASDDVSVTILAWKAAPEGLTATHQSTLEGTGSIQGLDAGELYEYRAAGASDFIAVAAGATAIEGLAPGAYEVRFAETGTTIASAAVTVRVLAYQAAPDASEAVIDYTAETISFGAELELNTAEDFSGTALTSGADLAAYLGQTLYLRKAAVEQDSEIIAAASAATAIAIPTRPATPAAPAIDTAGHTSITLVMVTGAEYRIEGGAWQSTPTFSDLTPDTEYTFEIRLKATVSAFASEVASAKLRTTETPVVTETVYVTGAPATVELGEDIDLTGVTLVVEFSDDTPDLNIPVTASMLTGYDKHATGTDSIGAKTITVTSGARSATFNIEVLDVLEDIIVAAPAKTDYEWRVDTQLDLTGGSVTKVMRSQIAQVSEPMTAAMLSDVALDTLGSHPVTVTAYGLTKSDAFVLTVRAIAQADSEPEADRPGIVISDETEFTDSNGDPVAAVDVSLVVETASDPEALRAAVANHAALAGIPSGNLWLLDISLQLTDGTKVQPDGPVTLLLPYPQGTDASYDFALLHIQSGGEIEILYPEKTAQHLRFTVSSFSDFALSWKKVVPQSDSDDDGEDYRAGESAFWSEVAQALLDAKAGDTVKATAGGYDRMPLNVIDALTQSPAELVIVWNGGDDIVFDAASAPIPERNRVFYPLTLLAELVQPASDAEAAPAPEAQTPDTTGTPATGEGTSPTSYYNPETGGVIEITAPEGVNGAVTPREAGLVSQPTPNAPAAPWLLMALALAATTLGAWTWRRRREEQ